jgi:hypothetical protein
MKDIDRAGGRSEAQSVAGLSRQSVRRIAALAAALLLGAAVLATMLWAALH